MVIEYTGQEYYDIDESIRYLFSDIPSKTPVLMANTRHLSNIGVDSYFYDESYLITKIDKREKVAKLVTIDGERIVCEVKCPKPEVFMEYKHKIVDNKSLKSVESKYFYQVQAEMMCTGCKKADFIVFCPFLKPNIHIVRITADESVQNEIEHRISEAEKIIESILKK